MDPDGSMGTGRSKCVVKWTYVGLVLMMGFDGSSRARLSLMGPCHYNGSKWILMGPDGSRWVQMDPDGSRWVQMDPDGSRCFLMGSNES